MLRNGGGGCLEFVTKCYKGEGGVQNGQILRYVIKVQPQSKNVNFKTIFYASGCFETIL
jgi:hypothetical protein